MIPKIIHYIWVGPNRLPNEYRRYIDQWQQLNPLFEVKEWNETNIDFSHPFIKAAYGSRLWAAVSDFARFDILCKYGGFYLDTDVELIKSLSPLMEDDCFFGFQVTQQHVDWVNGSVIGAVPNHPLIRKARESFDRLSGWRHWGSATGPQLVTRLLIEEGLKEYSENVRLANGVRLYGVKYFFPYSWLETFRPECVTEETIGVHHWEASWRKEVNRWKMFKRNLRRGLAATLPTLLWSFERRCNQLARSRI